MRSLLVLACLGLGACSDPADFLPARGVHELPSVKEAYRVPTAPEECRSIGFVKRASSIEDIARTVANNGGDRFVVAYDSKSTTTETDFAATKTFGIVTGSASSRTEKHHLFTAEAFRCAP